jgi:hypothetical protein
MGEPGPARSAAHRRVTIPNVKFSFDAAHNRLTRGGAALPKRKPLIVS